MRENFKPLYTLNQKRASILEESIIHESSNFVVWYVIYKGKNEWR